jgi:hypothetical protein
LQALLIFSFRILAQLKFENETALPLEGGGFKPISSVNHKTSNPSVLIASLLQEWRKQQEIQALAEACKLIEELDLGWDEECQTQGIAGAEISSPIARSP